MAWVPVRPRQARAKADVRRTLLPKILRIDSILLKLCRAQAIPKPTKGTGPPGDDHGPVTPFDGGRRTARPRRARHGRASTEVGRRIASDVARGNVRDE